MSGLLASTRQEGEQYRHRFAWSSGHDIFRKIAKNRPRHTRSFLGPADRVIPRPVFVNTTISGQPGRSQPACW